jgi:uncharacterized protein (TIGR03437 family)
VSGDFAEPAISVERAVADQKGAASLSVRLISAGMTFTAAQLDIVYSNEIADVAISRGRDLDAGKTLTSRVSGANGKRVLICGFNTEPLAGGVIVDLEVILKPGAPPGSHAIEISGAMATDAAGHAVSLAGGTGAAIVPGTDVWAPVVSTIANAASYSGGAVAPGEMVVIAGAGFAPVEVAARTAAGTLETLLAGVRVRFDGIPAPLLYVSPAQISAVVPYALDGRGRALLDVESQGIRSVLTPVVVVPAMPGIFTVDQSGAGQGVILNQDGTLNGSGNPAARGSFITVFGTGEGQTVPGGVDGMIVPPAEGRRPVLPVAVMIGDVEAEVADAGPVPGEPAGLFQMKVRVPEAIAPGALPIILKIGNSSSQAGVTVEIQ